MPSAVSSGLISCEGLSKEDFIFFLILTIYLIP
jgi:hypothetical protein